MRSAETELQNTIELRTTASEIVAPKPDLDARAKKKTILKHFLKWFLEGNSLAPKWRKSADKSLWQPSCSHSNTIYEVQLQKTIVLPMQPQHEATLTQPFTLRERSYSCKAPWNSIGNSSTSNTCNPIYSEGTILELQITMEFHRQLIHQHHLQSHLHCGNDPTVANHNGILSTANARNTGETPFTMRNRSETDPRMIREWSENDPTTHETVSHPSHRTGRSSTFGDGLCMEKHRVSCICYLSKTHFVRDFLQNSIGNSSTSTICDLIYIAGTILQLQITMNSVDRTCTKHSWNPIYNAEPIRDRSENEDPRMIRPHTRPSRTRRTAQLDHRRSGTDFVWKNTGFRASAISQKRISCETSFKTPSATHPPAPFAISIYIAGTILQLQITMKFCRPQMHETQVKPHLQCGTDPRPIRDHDPRMIREWSDHTRDRLAPVAPHS